MAEMRRLVGMLHEEEATPLCTAAGPEALDTLIDTVRAAGLPVELEVEGRRRDLPPGVDLAAYRVVQRSPDEHPQARRSGARLGAPLLVRRRAADRGREQRSQHRAGHRLWPRRDERTRPVVRRPPRERARPDGGYVVRAYVPIGSGT